MPAGLKRKLLAFLRPAQAGQKNQVPFLPRFPAYICLETTNACNLRCRQCLYQGGATEHYAGKIGYVEPKLAYKIFDQLK